MRVQLAKANLEILEKLNKEYRIPITTLANSCIYEKLGVKIKLLKEFNLSLASAEIDIKLRLFDNEKKYLIEASKTTGTNSLNQEIKLRLLNSIYEKRFLTPIELKSFNDMKFEINMIGRNLHQILKHLNFNEEFRSGDLRTLLRQLNTKIDDTKKEIDNILKYTKER